MTDGVDVRALVHAYFEAVNGEDYARAGGLFAPDGVLVAPGTPPRRGPREIEEYFRAALGPYPEHVDEPTRVVVAGTTVLAEIRFTGRTSSGAEIEFDAVDVFDLDRTGSISRLSSWYDSHAVRAALRSARQPDPPALPSP